MLYDSAHTQISANSGVDQGCPLSTCGFSAAIDRVLRSVLAEICTQNDSGAEFFAYLDDWYLWIKPQHLLQTFALMTAATRSVNLALQPTKIQVWRASCQDPITAELQDKVKLTLSCLGGHLQIHGDIEPSPVVVGEQASMEKTTQRFQRIATTLADLDADGLNAQGSFVFVFVCSVCPLSKHFQAYFGAVLVATCFRLLGATVRGEAAFASAAGQANTAPDQEIFRAGTAQRHPIRQTNLRKNMTDGKGISFPSPICARSSLTGPIREVNFVLKGGALFEPSLFPSLQSVLWGAVLSPSLSLWVVLLSPLPSYCF